MVGIHGEVGGCGEIGEKGELLTTYIRNEGCGFGDERVRDGDGGDLGMESCYGMLGGLDTGEDLV